MKLLKLLIFVSLFPIFVEARCNISDQKSLASNINILYEEKENNGEIYFDITFYNVQNNFYIVDEENNKYISKENQQIIINNFKSGGTYSFKIFSTFENCENELLIIKYVTLPSYNKHSSSEICTNNKDHILCQKWLKTNLSYDDLKKEIETSSFKPPIDNQKENPESGNESIFKIFIRYYWIGLIVIILISCLLIYKKAKKNNIFVK